ncbi:hypothetical protein D3C71_277560 [compost metagenome]
MPTRKPITAVPASSGDLEWLDFDTLATAGSFIDVTGEETFSVIDTSSDLLQLPRWLAVTNDGRRFVASLPWAWSERPLVADLAINKTTGAPRVEASDPRWTGLLELVTGGFSIGAAAVVKELVERNGLDEIESPIVAALVGTILVLSAESTERQSWDDWLDDIARSNTHIPDCAAVLGERHLQCRRYAEGDEWLRESVSRGLPFLSSTFRLLSLGFAQLEDDAQRRRISRALVSVDPTQPFTVLELFQSPQP